MSIYSDITGFYTRMMVKDILLEVERNGLKGDQHFCTCFNMNCVGVQIPDSIRERNKSEPRVLIIIRNGEYENLSVEDKGFYVDLGFDGIAERIFVPFTSIISFIDPSQNFHLSFDPILDRMEAIPSIPVKDKPKFDHKDQGNLIDFNQYIK
jgi:uncharacterized protein